MMNQTNQSPVLRTARPGDVFLLLLPTAQELHLLREKQRLLQSHFGGKIVDFVHITCERFSPDKESSEKYCIDYLKSNLKTLKPFPLFSDQLVQFFAPYWGEEVLRWQVLETDSYGRLRDLLAASLDYTGCGSHFDRRKPTTCTALRIEEKFNLSRLEKIDSFPFPLFEAKHLWVSKLVRENEFEILEKMMLEEKSLID